MVYYEINGTLKLMENCNGLFFMVNTVNIITTIFLLGVLCDHPYKG